MDAELFFAILLISFLVGLVSGMALMFVILYLL